MLFQKTRIIILFILLGMQMMNAQEISVSSGTSLETPVHEKLVGSEEENHHWYVKSNMIGWGFMMANLAGEIDMGKHWSFALPVYYSACDYFIKKVKFRTLTIQPEFRYWFNDSHSGWYTGVHGGISWFNFAFGGDYRFQDHNRCTPALGGGLNGGYRMPLGKNGRWWMEFSLGAGVYRVEYDKFLNRKNGEIMAYVKQVSFTVDQLAVSFAYRFDWKK